MILPDIARLQLEASAEGKLRLWDLEGIARKGCGSVDPRPHINPKTYVANISPKP